MLCSLILKHDVKHGRVYNAIESIILHVTELYNRTLTALLKKRAVGIGIWAIYAFRPLQAYDSQGRLVQGFLDHRVDAALAQLLLAADFSGSEICIESLPPADIQTALALRQSWSI